MTQFTPVKPMGLKLSTEIPSEDHVFQVKWDGVRILAWVSGGKVILYNRHMRSRTEQYPELQRLTQLLQAGDILLDGEMIAPRSDGRTSFSDILKRDFATKKNNMEQIPIHYVAFDILQFSGKFITSWPLEDRLEKLREVVVQDASEISAIDDFTGGENLFQATLEREMEGIVAKRKGSLYLPGQRTEAWLKIKHRRRGKFFIVGYTLRDGRVNSLVMGERSREEGLRVVGKTGSGLTQNQIAILTSELPRLSTGQAVSLGFPRNAVPVHPYLMAEVEFMEWTDELLLRAPALKSISFGGESHQSQL